MALDTSGGNPSDTLPSWDNSNSGTAVHHYDDGTTKGTRRGQQRVAVASRSRGGNDNAEPVVFIGCMNSCITAVTPRAGNA